MLQQTTDLYSRVFIRKCRRGYWHRRRYGCRAQAQVAWGLRASHAPKDPRGLTVSRAVRDQDRPVQLFTAAWTALTPRSSITGSAQLLTRTCTPRPKYTSPHTHTHTHTVAFGKHSVSFPLRHQLPLFPYRRQHPSPGPSVYRPDFSSPSCRRQPSRFQLIIIEAIILPFSHRC